MLMNAFMAAPGSARPAAPAAEDQRGVDGRDEQRPGADGRGRGRGHAGTGSGRPAGPPRPEVAALRGQSGPGAHPPQPRLLRPRLAPGHPGDGGARLQQDCRCPRLV